MKMWFALLLSALMPISLAGREHCSLIVSVVDNSGREVEALVTVTEANGHSTKRENEIGGAKFCGLGILPVTVSVGRPNTCNQVTVRNVVLRWGETIRLKVVHDRGDCLIDVPPNPTPQCEVLLRFVTSRGDEIRDVSLAVQEPFKSVLKGDRYGRIRTLVAEGSVLVGTGTAAGFRPETIRIPCSIDDSPMEKQVVLNEGSRLR